MHAWWDGRRRRDFTFTNPTLLFVYDVLTGRHAYVTMCFIVADGRTQTAQSNKVDRWTDGGVHGLADTRILN